MVVNVHQNIFIGGGGGGFSWATGLPNMVDGVIPTPWAQIGKYEKKSYLGLK